MPTTRESLAVSLEELVCRAVRHLSPDMVNALQRAAGEEADRTARDVIAAILDKAHEAREKGRGLSSDIGLLTFFVRAGCSFPGIGQLQGAIHDAVHAATRHEPLDPHTTDVVTGTARKDNLGRGLPVVHFDLVPGADDCSVTLLVKGAASEALTALWILPPKTSFAQIGDRLASHVAEAGGKPCPPLVVGVGLGGTPEVAMMLSRKALLRPLGQGADEEDLRDAEHAWKDAINRTGIGPMGLGGGTTVLAVHAECADRHRAALPVALSVGCWSDRRASVTLDRSGIAHWAP